MGTFTRSIFGLIVGAVSLGALLFAGGQVYRAVQDSAASQTEVRRPKERIFSVNVGTLEAETVTPVIISYGKLYSWRTLELRSSVAGAVVELADNFKDGGEVSEGEVLFRVDPARLETSVALASSDLDEAAAELQEVKAAVELAKLEVEAAATQFEIRQQALSRQQGLRDRGVGTEESVEAAALSLSSAEQALIGRRQVQAQNQARVAQSEIAVDRRKVALDEARRALAEATVAAPFAGVMSGVSAVRGGLVSMNEKLGELIDPSAMEVAFRVTNTQFARLLNSEGKLRKAEVTLALQHGKMRTEVAAKIERTGAEVGEGQVGRLVYARLIDPDLTLLRPGDFVTIEIPERPLSDVARIPGTAASADGRILVIGEGNRLEEVQAKLLRQQGDELIVGDVPFGQQYVLARAQQLGPGIQVQPVAPQPEGAAATLEPVAPETIALDEDRRARLIAFVEASENMQAESKEKVLGELRKPEVLLEIVERFEAKMEQ